MSAAVLLAVLMAAVAGCKRAAAVNPERAFTLYDIAWRCGQRDRLTPNRRDWRRYEEKLKGFVEVANREKIFEGGYEDGFDQHPDEPVSDAVVEYDRAFRRGRVDAWVGKDSGERLGGYRDGHDGKAHAFGRGY